MKNTYLVFIIIIVLTLITILISLTHTYVIYPLLNKPMIHENCTIFYNCSPGSGIFGKIKCSCVYYYEKDCVDNCKHPEQCQLFVHRCPLKE